jgi:hypothetical protein
MHEQYVVRLLLLLDRSRLTVLLFIILDHLATITSDVITGDVITANTSSNK